MGAAPVLTGLLSINAVVATDLSPDAVSTLRD
jgi:hypothetical protein